MLLFAFIYIFFYIILINIFFQQFIECCVHSDSSLCILYNYDTFERCWFGFVRHFPFNVQVSHKRHNSIFYMQQWMLETSVFSIMTKIYSLKINYSIWIHLSFDLIVSVPITVVVVVVAVLQQFAFDNNDGTQWQRFQQPVHSNSHYISVFKIKKKIK